MSRSASSSIVGWTPVSVDVTLSFPTAYSLVWAPNYVQDIRNLSGVDGTYTCVNAHPWYSVGQFSYNSFYSFGAYTVTYEVQYTIDGVPGGWYPGASVLSVYVAWLDEYTLRASFSADPESATIGAAGWLDTYSATPQNFSGVGYNPFDYALAPSFSVGNWQ